MSQPIVHDKNPVDWIVNITYEDCHYQVDMADDPKEIEVYLIENEINSVEIKKNTELYDVLRAAATRWFYGN